MNLFLQKIIQRYSKMSRGMKSFRGTLAPAEEEIFRGTIQQTQREETPDSIFTDEQKDLLIRKNIYNLNPDNLEQMMQLIQTQIEGRVSTDYLEKSGTELVWESPLLDKERERYIFMEEFYKDKPIEVSEGIYQCKRCGDRKTVSTEKQTRSADEPMTVFITCLSCGNKWKE